MASVTVGEATERHYHMRDPWRTARVGESHTVLYGFDGAEVRDGVASVYVKMQERRVARQRVDALSTLADADGRFVTGLAGLDLGAAGPVLAGTDFVLQAIARDAAGTVASNAQRIEVR